MVFLLSIFHRTELRLIPLRLAIAVTFVALLTSVAAVAQVPVEPLLQKYCLACHHENGKEGGLSLQTPESLKKGGDNGPVLDKANPSASLLLAVLKPGTSMSMPPVDEAQPTPEERAALQKWVLAGAPLTAMAAGIPDVPSIKPGDQVQPPILSSALLPDAKQVAMGGSRFVAVQSLTDFAEVWRTPISDGNVFGLSAAKNNPWIIAATGTPGIAGAAVVLSAVDGKVVETFAGHTDAIYAAVLSPDESQLATAGYDRRILIHDVASKKIQHVLEGHNGSVFSLSFDPSGKVLCSASADGTVKVWSVDSGQRLDTLSQPQAEQYSVLVSRTGDRIFAAGADNRIRIWQLVSKTKPRINPVLVSQFAHEQPITRLAMSPDGSLLASSAEDGTLRTWTTTPFAPLQTLPQQPAIAASLTFLDNNRLLITRMDGSVEVQPLQNTTPAEAASVTAVRSESAMQLLTDELQQIAEAETDNNAAAMAQPVTLPAEVRGHILPAADQNSDVDCYRFSAVAGQKLLLEVNAARSKSPLDSKVEVLTSAGERILRTQLQAVRDSYFTFRGKDSDTSDDFRVFNWQEMELNEYLYSDGEVVRLWLYPRGPDSGFQVYPGFGKRFTWFGTTPTSHALQAPCFVVVPRDPEETLVANGLPVFPVYYENDDDGRRELGSDSRLFFTAPADGEYVVRVSDARGFGGADFHYALTVREPRPGFQVTLSTKKLTVAPLTGQEITFTAKRIDGYDGPIVIDAEALPEGFAFSGPIEIQQDQLRAFGTVFALANAAQPTPEQVQQLKFVARTGADTSIGESQVEIGGLQELKLAEDAKLRVKIVSADAVENSPPAAAAAAQAADEQKVADAQQAAAPVNPEPVVLQIRPGETIRAFVRLERIKHDGVVSFGRADAGRNLPHGVYVDNIGLNGLLLLEDQSQREFFVTAAKWVPPSTSTFFLKSNVDGNTSFPVTLEVLPATAKPSENSVTATEP